MKQKIVLLAIAILCGMNVLATNLVIERYAGAEMVQDIAVIGKWVFVDTNLQLLDKEGNILATEPLDNVREEAAPQQYIQLSRALGGMSGSPRAPAQARAPRSL